MQEKTDLEVYRDELATMFYTGESYLSVAPEVWMRPGAHEVIIGMSNKSYESKPSLNIAIVYLRLDYDSTCAPNIWDT
mgnify:CR=1 FL=1